MPRKRADGEPRLSQRRSNAVSRKERDTRTIPAAKRRDDSPPRESWDPDSAELRLALAQLPGRLRDATGLFRELTGFTAVTSFASPVTNLHGVPAIPPPMHPMCVSRLRNTRGDPPCEEQWQEHLKAGIRERSVQRHVCPLGLRCSCVPIYYGESFAGVAKCVAGPRTNERRFSRAIRQLELAVSNVCQDFRVSMLTRQLEALKERVEQLQEIRHAKGPAGEVRPATASKTTKRAPTGGGGAPVDRALDHIAQHYLDPGLCLKAVSEVVGVNDSYLAHSFTVIVGQRMHAYILQLRTQHACRLLLQTDHAIKLVGYESGFVRTDVFRRTFRQHVGVAPGVYRQAFARV